MEMLHAQLGQCQQALVITLQQDAVETKHLAELQIDKLRKDHDASLLVKEANARSECWFRLAFVRGSVCFL